MKRQFINNNDEMNMININSQIYEMGSSSNVGQKSDNEGPPEIISTQDFYMSETTVTNKQFTEFVKQTGYITVAEKINSSFVFYQLIDKKNFDKIKFHRTSPPWWLDVRGANWKCPEGPGSSIQTRMDHPVAHIAWNDAVSYSEWAGGRLPTEAEWEVAARGNTRTDTYPWGDALVLDGVYNANTWQGTFPSNNTKKDGYLGTAPVTEFYKDENGVCQMIGNVWEWCLNPGKIPLKEFQNKISKDFIRESKEKMADLYALRGGSFLCHYSYCNRYRIAARNSNTPLSSASNIGFRYIIEAI